MKNIIFAIGMTVLTFGMSGTAKAGVLDSLQIRARVGYSIGGTTPIPLPETIRSIDSYSLTPSFLVGIDAKLPLNEKWGISAGLHYENKGMKAEVTTKAYHMEVIKGEAPICRDSLQVMSARSLPSGCSPSLSRPHWNWVRKSC